MDAFANYDAWLEKPYQDACRRAEEEEQIIEQVIEDLGLTEAEVEEFDFGPYIEEALEAAAEAEAEARYEAYLEAREYDDYDSRYEDAYERSMGY